MAKKTKRRSPKKKASRSQDAGVIVGLLLVIFFSIFAIFQLGLFGIYLADFARFFFGNLYQITLLPIMAWALIYLIMDKNYPIATHIYVGVLMMYLATALLSSMLFFNQNEFPAGNFPSQIVRIIGQELTNHSTLTPVGAGMVGALLYQLTYTLLADIGTAIVIATLYLAGVIVTFRVPARDIAQKGVIKAHENFTEFQKEQNKKRDQRQLLAEKQKQDLTEFGDDPFGLSKSEPDVNQPSTDPFFGDPVLPTDDDVPPVKSESSEPVEPKINWQAPAERQVASSFEAPTPTVPTNQPEVELNSASPADDDYRLPETSLLTQTKPTDQSKEAQSLNAKSRLVHDTLQSFGVDATVSSVSLGPTVTQYELKPGQGVKVNRIANLADDLALALAAKSIRIEAPIPGKPYVGIEVPNDSQAVVGFRDMVEQSKTVDQDLLTVPLGRDVTGNIISADLAAMPHLLIAGSTGSGKSVGLNGIIVSLLLKAKPSEVKLMMVDPKVVELSIYNGIPHLLTPVVSDPRKAAKSLQKLVDEMENRYDLLAQFSKRNIGEYNAAVEENNAHAKETGNALMTKLPYIVAVVDEFADLMATVGSEIEVSIARLGAKARAAGIHMILATQRPDVKVINGTIKSNIPGRIAFRTASGIDSRTILDTNGAEKLLGRGDMIFAPPGKPQKRLQ
ncbi:DNA translocase FtsK, partial [Fructobacillus ficulneus]